MTTTQDRLEVLRMIQNGQITAEEGARLLEAIQKSTHLEESEQPSPSSWAD